MPFQTPITIAKTLDKIHRHEYVLPAIQRQFVWSPEQICRLFDSLMRGYPFGSFLFWKVNRENCNRYVFYDFVRDYHERDAPLCSRLDLTGETSVVAVLDGQQRLTALNIGLRGSHAEKLPYKRWSNNAAYPVCRLYLNLRGSKDPGPLGLAYQFEFLTEEQVRAANTRGQHFFRVGEILRMAAGPQMFTYVREHGLADDDQPYALLHRLHAVIHTDLLVTFFEEEAQDLDHVLNIFIRVNSGGTVLSYADLLLSIATAQWKNRDAREAVYGLVEELNNIKHGFDFPKDFVLKACLVLADISDVGFKVGNFDAKNMGLIEKMWDRIAASLRLAVRLVGDFGFSAKTLTANNVILPIAYYLMKRSVTETYLTSRAEEEDRERVRRWVVRSLVKAGVWGSGLDTLLRDLRKVLQDHGSSAFPSEQLEAAMVPLGKSLKFDDEAIDALLESRYGHQGTFAILSLLYPGKDLRDEFHEDHIFPRSQMTQRQLVRAGVSEELAAPYSDLRDQLPNLQLLLGPENIAKRAMHPKEWVEQTYKDPTARGYYAAMHDLGDLPVGYAGFGDFFAERRKRMADRLRSLLST